MKSIIRDFWGKVHRREGTEARFKRLNHISEILLPFGVAGSGGGVGVGVPSGSTIKNPPAVQKMQETWVQSLGREDALERAWESAPVFLPGESHGQRSLVGYSPCSGKSQT